MTPCVCTKKPIAFIRQSPHSRVVSHASYRRLRLCNLAYRSDRGSPDRDTPRPNLARDRPLTRLATSRRPDARRDRHGNISPHLFPTRDGVVVGAPSTASAIPSSCPSTAKPSGCVLSCPFAASHDSINHRGTRSESVFSPARISHRVRVSINERRDVPASVRRTSS